MRAVAALAFLCSGASSLVFQAIWTRLLHHVFGATSVAMSSVLTAFMAGLGLGAHLFGRRAGRVKNPLRAYALCELGVAVWALGLPLVLTADGPIADLNLVLREQLGAESFGFMVARFACVLPLLLVPTTLMGGTLPFLAQHFVRSEGEASARTGTLYAINTVGAVLGTAAGSFWLMPTVGVHATNLCAVGINALLGVGLLFFARRLPPAEQASRTESVRSLPPWARTLAVVSFALSGACAMTYEVVWSRALAMAIGSSLQSFALILVTFLCGIAGGSALVSHLLDLQNTGRRVGVIAASFLSLIALSPALALEQPWLALLVWATVSAGLAGYAVLTARSERRAALMALELDGSFAPSRDRSSERMLVVPLALVLVELTRFGTRRGGLSAVATHGYLPVIAAAVVLAITLFVWLSLRFRDRPWLLAGAMQLSVALATLVGYAFQDDVPYTFARLVSGLSDLPHQVGVVRFFMLLTAGMCTLPATLGMGAMFPVTLALWAQRGSDPGSDVGTVYASNTLGSIAGSWLPGFVLLPRFGMEATLRAGMLLNALTALVVLAAGLWIAGLPRRATRALTAFATLAVCALSVLVFTRGGPMAWNPSRMTLGAFRVSLARDVLDVASWGQPDLLYYRDGVSTTVSVERWGAHLSLKNNGKVDASNGDDMPTQIMVAAYPLLLHPRGPKGLDVAIVGFGSGVTVGAALSFPVRHIDAMELETGVIEAGARFFGDVSGLPQKSARFPYVENPRLTLHNDDGRNFLASTRKQYDVIISEPSNPWITGVSDLFTVDHFRISKRRLKKGGVYCQWVQLYEMSPENIKTIYRTFASNFRYVVAFAAEELSSDTVLVGSDEPLPLDLVHTERVMADPRVKRELTRAFVHAPYDMWSRTLFVGQDELMRFTQREFRRERGVFQEKDRTTGAEPCPPATCRREPSPLNTDDNMRIELRAPSDLIGFARYAGYLQLFYGDAWPYGDLSKRLAGLDDPERRARMVFSLLAHGRYAQARRLLDAMPGELPSEGARLVRTARLLLDIEAVPRVAYGPPEPGPGLSRATRSALLTAHRNALAAEAREDLEGALRELDAIAAPLRNAAGPGLRFFYADLTRRAAQGDAARERTSIHELETLVRDEPDYAAKHPEAWYALAEALAAGSSFDRAARSMRRYAELTETTAP